MNLYDEMNKKKPLVVEPEVAEAPVLEPVEPVAVEEVVVEPVKAKAPVSEHKYTSWWKSPEYEKQVAELANVAEKRRETDKKQAKWNRNVAIFSDIARLGAQVGANAGGAYMIDRTTPFTDKATEKLERLRKEHAAEIEGYAQKLKEAKLKDREDLMNRNIAEVKYKQADDELKYKKQKDAIEYAYKIAKDEELRERWEAEQAVREENAETNKKRANNSGSGKDTQVKYDAYHELIAVYPEYTVQKKIVKKNEYTGKWEVDEQGKYVYDYTDDDNPSIRAVENMLAKAKAEGKWDGSKVIEKPKVKKANPMGSGKKTNPMN